VTDRPGTIAGMPRIDRGYMQALRARDSDVR
jgi:hypothetical protein